MKRTAQENYNGIMMTTEALKATNQKSFYGKAKILHNGHKHYLKSYNTIMLCYNDITKDLFKIDGTYSVTTLNHINAFCSHFGISGFNKKQWLNFDSPSIVQPIYYSNGFFEAKTTALYSNNVIDEVVSNIEEKSNYRVYAWYNE